MFKLNKKLLLSVSTAALLSLGLSACMENLSPSGSNTAVKGSIDGGVSYPVVNSKTGPYNVNTKAHSATVKYGRVPTKNEYNAWNTDIMPDGTGLPEGQGTAEEGSDLYDEKCTVCHGDFGSGGGGYPSLSKGNAYELHKTLINQRITPDSDGPVRVFGTYWPKATTLWWYIKDAMPHPATGTLTDDEVYSLVAFILNANEMKIKGVEVDDEYVLNREKLLELVMPNNDGFEPKIDGPNGPENVRKFFANPANFGGQKVKPSGPCMKNCQEPTAKVVYIKNGGIHDFHPKMSDTRDLPKEKATAFDAKKAYADNCAMCHDTGVAPAPGDKPAWAGYLSHGMNTVYEHAIKGIGGMPAKGGSSLTDTQFKTVVDYIVNQSK